MIPEITTFTLRAAFKIPGISAHKAPAIPAPKIAKIQTKLSGIKVALNAINTAVKLPTKYCPGTPILNSPHL